ncbi:hypothetical protein ACLB90_01655 [Stenotrophomonas sp. LGBM10]|uniref:hypothetical protein n=1 Tax=Stenotrophomonas sp. LGBM10 TaxID=3390038 RepID=UPI00398B1B14
MAVMQIQYNEDGHGYTTFVVARLAGWCVSSALELAWGSQLPDEFDDLKATRNAIKWLNGGRPRQIMKVLHSLHGSDVAKRRTRLARCVADMLTAGTEHWKIGVVIHAFADSFAHTKIVHSEEVAYDAPIGHLLDGHKPDHVPLFPAKFIDYVNALYTCLEPGGQEKKKGIGRVVEIAHLFDFDERIKRIASDLDYDAKAMSVVQDRLKGRATIKKVYDLLDDLESKLV